MTKSVTAIVLGARVFAGSNNGKVYSIDMRDGGIQWEFQMESWVWSTPAYDQGIVYIGSDDRYLYALDAALGDLVWRHDTGISKLDREAFSGV